jgi:polyisoprenoid-binding protein YceI
MKRSIYLRMALLALAMIAFTNARAFSADKYEIDPVHSFPTFKVRHLGISTVTGVFTDISGTIMFDKKIPSKSSVSIIVKTTSVNTNSQKRDEDLRSSNFFDVDKYPEMKFVSKKVAKGKGNTYRITGIFTMHGVSRTITVPVSLSGQVKDPWGGFRSAFTANFSIKRSDYGMKSMIPLVGDKIDITLEVEAVKK